MLEPELQRRRRPRRTDINTTAIVLAPDRPGVAFLIDSLSPGGARLIGPLSLARDQRLGVLLEVDGHPFEVTAEVIACESFDLEADLVTVRFVALSAATRDRVATLADQVRELEEGTRDEA